MKYSIPSLSRPALLLALLACSTPLLAADPAKPAAKTPAATAAPAESGNVLTFGKGKPTGAMLNRDQLRTCLKTQAGMKTDGETLRAEKTELTTLTSDLEKNEAALNAERATVDATKAEAVNAFNEKLKNAQAAATDLKARQLAFNQKVDAYQATGEGFKRDCADRPYSELDWFAIQRGK